MPLCPNCKTKIDAPQRLLSVPSDLNRQLIFSEHKIALYECSRCQLKFPVGAGKTRLKIIDASEWESLKKKAGEFKNLQARVEELESKIQYLDERLKLKELSNRQEKLDFEVTLLRGIKTDLQEEIMAIRRMI